MPLNMKPSLDAVVDALQRIIVDATTALELAPDGLRRMAEAEAGYPSAPSTGAAAMMPLPDAHGTAGWSCPSKGCGRTSDGSEPYHVHWQTEHGPTASTQPERYASVTGDEAARHAAALVRHIANAGSNIIGARRLLEQYGVTKIGHAAVADPINDRGCTSCAQDHRYSERRPNGTQCGWCAKKLAAINGIRAQQEPPLARLTLVPLAMVRKRHQGRDVTAGDVEHWALTDEPIRPRTGNRRPQRDATRELRETRDARVAPGGVL